MMVYHCLMAKHCRTAGKISKIWPNLRQETENCQHKWMRKCDGRLYNGADSVHCPLLYIYNGKTSITKEQNDGIPLLDGQTLSNSRFDFENLAQYFEARELPTGGCASVMEGPTMVLIVFIALYYTYTMAKHR